MNISKEMKIELDNKAYKCANEIRKKFNLGDNPLPDIYSLELSKEFLLLKFPNDYKISGVYLEKKGRDKTYKCIYINTLEPLGRQAFTFAHEIYHSFFELSNDCVCLENKRRKDPVEFTAEKFASYLLIPRIKLVEELKKRCINKSMWVNEEKIFEMQKIFGVSFQALLYAISELKKHHEYKQFIPKNMVYLSRYYKPEYWNTLAIDTEKYDSLNKLNSVNPIFEWPKGFKENIINNLDKAVIDITDIEDIMSFFEG
jgi:Zn-dependent peptidase ImmA (M78 family)